MPDEDIWQHKPVAFSIYQDQKGGGGVGERRERVSVFELTYEAEAEAA